MNFLERRIRLAIISPDWRLAVACKRKIQRRSYLIHHKSLDQNLDVADPTVHKLIRKEAQIQQSTLNLIPMANYILQNVRSAVGSVFQNPNSEGYIGNRYYPGTKFIDESEASCQRRALQVFGLNDRDWAVNVQSHNLSLAALQVLSAFLPMHGRVLCIGRPQCRFLAKYYEVIEYHTLLMEPEPINYASLEKLVASYQPRIISIAPAPFQIDYSRLQAIAENVAAHIITDISHNAGLIATGMIKNSPFVYSSVITTATQPSLRGPPGTLIFSKKQAVVKSTDRSGTEETIPLHRAIDQSVFPRHQGGPHCHSICGIGVALHNASKKAFHKYQENVVHNARTLQASLRQLGWRVEGPNENWNSSWVVLVLDESLSAAYVHRVLERIGIACCVDLDTKILHFGTAAMTARGFGESEFAQVAEIINSVLGGLKCRDLDVDMAHWKAKVERLIINFEIV